MGVLPTKKRGPVIDIRGLNVLIYGVPKIGKSTLASEAEGAIFFACEDGVKTMDVFEHPCRQWADVEAGYEDLMSMHQDYDRIFRTVIIDTIDNYVAMASDRLCKDMNVEHESDADWGKGFSLLKKKVMGMLQSISGMRDSHGDPSYGLWMISHSQSIEKKDRGEKWNITVPSLSGSIRKAVAGFADLILYAEMVWDPSVGNEGEYVRVLKTKPSGSYVAGDRTGRLPEAIEMVKGHTYEALVQALEGEQDEAPPPKKATKKKAAPKKTAKKKAAPKKTAKKKAAPKKTAKKKASSPEPAESEINLDRVDINKNVSPEDQAPDQPKESTEETGPPVDVQEPPPEDKNNGKPPQWTIDIWKRWKKAGVTKEDAIDRLSKLLREQTEDEEAVWSSDWILANEHKIHPIHIRLIEREVDRYIEQMRGESAG